MTEQVQVQDEFEILKAQAVRLGLQVHHNIGLERLRKIVADKLKEGTEDTKPVEQVSSSYKKKDSIGEAEAAKHALEALRMEASRLVRIQITCMNPAKRRWQGELFTAGNTVVGTHSKFVVFNKPWHVPNILLNMIKDREFPMFYEEKVNGTTVKRTKMVPEFNVVVLPNLTQNELNELRREQKLLNNKDY